MDKYIIKRFIICSLCGFLLLSCSQQKATINIAVASNFETTLKQIIPLYKEHIIDSLHINVIAASSGVLSSQIINNAPFDLFLSADNEKPSIIQQRLGSTQSVNIYAIGQLALWIPKAKDNNHCLAQLKDVKTLAIANPKTAPYGKVAFEILKNNNIEIQKIIRTSSVAQTYLYTQENLAQAGFVALPMLKKESKGCIQIFQDNKLSQSMILLNNKAKDFHDFLLSKEVQQFIQDSGYISLSK
ncbi:MAG: molybdate ABC transporter substrate-binding protein [Marinicellaceae bacterium]